MVRRRSDHGTPGVRGRSPAPGRFKDARTSYKSTDRFKEFIDVAFGGVPKTLYEAVFADIEDAIPIVGDILDIRRVVEYKKPQQRFVEAIDTLVGIIPGVGDVADLLFPSSTINYLMTHRKVVLPKIKVPAPPRVRIRLP